MDPIAFVLNVNNIWHKQQSQIPTGFCDYNIDFSDSFANQQRTDLWRAVAATRHKPWYTDATRHKPINEYMPPGTKQQLGQVHPAQNLFGGRCIRHKSCLAPITRCQIYFVSEIEVGSHYVLIENIISSWCDHTTINWNWWTSNIHNFLSSHLMSGSSASWLQNLDGAEAQGEWGQQGSEGWPKASISPSNSTRFRKVSPHEAVQWMVDPWRIVDCIKWFLMAMNVQDTEWHVCQILSINSKTTSDRVRDMAIDSYGAFDTYLAKILATKESCCHHTWCWPAQLLECELQEQRIDFFKFMNEFFPADPRVSPAQVLTA